VTIPWDVRDLGVAPFHETWALQLALVEQRQRGEVRDTLIIVEHPHVFTLGRKREAEANVLAPGDVPIVAIERGGDVTYHGPGQLVAYPICLLQDGERDLHAFLRHLEDAAIATCARYGVVADREPGKTGAWTTVRARPAPSASPNGDAVGSTTNVLGSRKKLASIGIACRKWVTFHGIALNVTTDLSYFARINPCGFEASVMTSLAQLAPTADLSTARASFVADLGTALMRQV
jgi:lipoyl(octanoyl) transferase